MATEVGSLYYDLDINDKNLRSQLSNADSQVQGFGRKLNQLGDNMRNVGQKMTMGLTLPIVAGFGASIKAASDLQETLNKVDVAFKDQAKKVREWAKTSITSMGLAKESALDAAALFGDMATSMGLTTEEAAKMSMGLTQLGADLASFKNISFEEAQTALAGVFTGETESLKRLGVVMTETNLLEFARAKGITKTVQEMTQAEKVQLRYNYILDKTKNAQGDFIRTADGTANQLRMTRERFKELSATIGERLLPMVNKALAGFGKVIDFVTNLSPKTQTLILQIAAIVAAIGPLVYIFGVLLSPIGLVIAAIGAVVLILQQMGVSISDVGNFLQGLWEKIQPLLPTMDQLRGFGQQVADVFVALWHAAQNVWDFIVNMLQPSLSALARTFINDVWPSVKRLWDALNPGLFEALKVVAIIIGGAVVAGLWVFINVLNIVISIVSTVINWISNLINWFGNLVGAVINAVSAIIGWFSRLPGTVSRIYHEIVDWFGRLPGTIKNAIEQIPGIISDMVGNVVSKIWNFYGQFVDAGWGLMKAFINGIKGGAEWVYNTVKDVARKVRNLLPFSDAKEGPFSDLTLSGKRFSQTFAKGIVSGSSAVVDAVENALALPNGLLNPTINATMAGGGGLAAAGAASVSNANTIVNIGTIQDKSDADYILNRMDREQNLINRGGSRL